MSTFSFALSGAYIAYLVIGIWHCRNGRKFIAVNKYKIARAIEILNVACAFFDDDISGTSELLATTGIRVFNVILVSISIHFINKSIMYDIYRV